MLTSLSHLWRFFRTQNLADIGIDRYLICIMPKTDIFYLYDIFTRQWQNNKTTTISNSFSLHRNEWISIIDLEVFFLTTIHPSFNSWHILDNCLGSWLALDFWPLPNMLRSHWSKQDLIKAEFLKWHMWSQLASWYCWLLPARLIALWKPCSWCGGSYKHWRNQLKSQILTTKWTTE